MLMNDSRLLCMTAIWCCALFLPGCGSMPKVKVGYYLPMASVAVTLTQSATCTAGNVPILQNDVLITTNYSRDPTELYKVDLSQLGNAWSKADAGFEFHDDGRLKSVNTSQTGQGAEATKALLTLVASAAALKNVKAVDEKACAALREFAGGKKLAAGSQKSPGAGKTPDSSSMKGAATSSEKDTAHSDAEGDDKAAPKALTIVSRGKITLPETPKTKAQKRGAYADDDPIFNTQAPGTFDLKQDSLPAEEFSRVASIYGKPSGTVTYAHANTPHENVETEGQLITVVEPGTANIVVKVALNRGGDNYDEELRGSAQIPQVGKTFQLPIQKAPLFGSNSFELALSDSGRVTKLKYSGGGDAAGVFGVIDGALGIKGKDPSAADQAKDVQGEADLIYQQQRLVMCKADPTACPK
jgi:hypothetical protein